MSFVAKYFRLLPAVVVVGTGLLALKGVDLARAAQAPASEYGDPDNTGLAPSDNGGAPASRDFASDEGASGSAAEVDVLSSLTRRRAELDARERALAMRENILSAGEGRVDQKIGALKTLQSQIQALLTERDAKQDDQIKALIKAYGPDGMAPKKAAGIFNTMPDEVLIPIAKGMKPADLGGILQAMNPDAAQRLTVKLASLLKLPDPPPATVCPDPMAATPASTDITSPVTNPVVSLNPPVTTAALTNPTVTPLPLPLPPAPAPVAAPPPAQTAPAAAPPKPQASTPPKPMTPPAQHPAKPVATPPAKPLATPPAKPTTASAPAKPSTASAAPPVKPITAAAAPAKPASAPLPITAPTPAPASTPPAKPSTQAAAAPTTPPASAAPTPLAPAHGG